MENERGGKGDVVKCVRKGWKRILDRKQGGDTKCEGLREKRRNEKVTNTYKKEGRGER